MPKPRWSKWSRAALALFLCAGFHAASQTLAQAPLPADAAADIEKKQAALARANAAVVGVRSTAVEDALSNDSLGRVREGSGVVIGADGLVLTIGYLILEADHVELVLDSDRVVPARVVANDLASGFGLLQPLVPLRVAPANLGSAATLSSDEPLMIASGGEDADLSVAHMVSRRAFSGYWEYHIDSALFTAPPRVDHSGAGLFNAKGELLGIGSLVVMDAMGPGHPNIPGNMFVPVDLLKPILDELRQRGMSHYSRRAWLGLNCVEIDGKIRVVRVTPDSPAEAAGALPGDHILRIDDTPVSDLERFYKTLWRGSEPEREIMLQVSRGGGEKTLRVRATDRMKTLRQAKGI
jgi:serine protease Do